ncbi:uncharacterized protein EV154DRAFT_487563 [Mucor mucedo]|uniref:uncharacterized protein n=1 Tax=Mucor mucedo TaxID=29922 RepID=UPI00221F9651|nr:uncharacterized protein EV154DRAFT_487563 [Mucor mucedo]KAI7872238.1 hypothetical protein EV154DRAFT_487563 [Mucor mucedo]
MSNPNNQRTNAKGKSKQRNLNSFFVPKYNSNDSASSSLSNPTPIIESTSGSNPSTSVVETLSSTSSNHTTNIDIIHDTRSTSSTVSAMVKEAEFTPIDGDEDVFIDLDPTEDQVFHDINEVEILSEEIELRVDPEGSFGCYRKGALWMPKESDEFHFVLSGETSPRKLYEHDVFVWLPHLLFGQGFKKLVCPECGTEDVAIKGYNDNPVARRIICEEK